MQDATVDASEELLRHLALMGGSPHGARPKILVNFEPDTEYMSNTEQAAGKPWLVKFPITHSV